LAKNGQFLVFLGRLLEGNSHTDEHPVWAGQADLIRTFGTPLRGGNKHKNETFLGHSRASPGVCRQLPVNGENGQKADQNGRK
jgi:hypothetical protein